MKRFNGSLRVQLMVYMVLLISIPLLFLTAFGNYFYAQAIDDQATSFTAQMLEQVQINIDANVRAVDLIIGYLSVNPQVLSFLSVDDFYTPGRVDIETEARLQVLPYLDANPDLISGILIANRDDLYISGEMYRIARYPIVEDDWYKAAVEAGGERVLLSKPIGRNIRNIHNTSADGIVSVARAVKSPENGEVLGVIMADMRLDAIENHIRDLTLGKNGYVFVMDDEGQMVYAPVNRTVYRIPPTWVGEQSTGRALHTIDGESYLLLSTHSKLVNWRTVGVFKSGEALGPVLSLRRYTLIVALIAVIIGGASAITLSASFTKPISRLRMLMAQAENGNLNVSFGPPSRGGEIAQLGQSFNSMMDEIRSLLHLVYVEQRNKREADIKTLQAQIKPHFLYNTLDTIRWMAEERGAGEIVQMVSALTKLFRIGLSRGRDIISLADEIEHIKCYLYIQQVRYEDKLNYSIDVDPHCLSLRVNKLILQPLVENAIYHGIKQKRGAGHISVEALEQDGKLLMRISDDGAGMSEAQCAELNRALRASSRLDSDKGYGIFNVNDRIRLSYGNDYGLTYGLNPGGGIVVTIVHPMIDGGSAGSRE